MTITGTDFTGATGVTIGGTAVTSFTVDSATQITATTPAHAAGAVSVIVTTPGGANTANMLYTFVVPIPNTAPSFILPAGPGGLLDTTFANPNLSISVSAVALAGSKGKLLVGGSGPITNPDSLSTPYLFLARFNEDGTLDTTFANPNLGGPVSAVAVDGNGKIVVGGYFTTAGSGSSACKYLARFNADGTLDTTFANPNLDNPVRALVLDGNGKIVVAGYFTTAGSESSPRNFLARFNADGTLDTTFANPNLGSPAGTVAVDGDGKILVGGSFPTAGSGNSTYARLARFNADGTLDTTFANPNLNSDASALAVDGTGRVLVGGQFTTAGSGMSAYKYLARFNTDGTLDTTFVNPNLSSYANALLVDGKGKILAAGSFTTAGSGNSSVKRLARFNADGTLDTTFTNPNLNETAAALAVDGTGRILAGGQFGTAGSGNRPYGNLARFSSSSPYAITVAADSGLVTSNNVAQNISVGPANESEQVVNFLVSNDNHGLFSVQPAIDANGTLTFTPLVSAVGTATVTVQAHDSGGTADGGVDTSAAQTFTITTLNTAPTVASAIPSFSVLEDAANVVTNLTAVFSDAQTPAVSLTYAVVANTNSGLVTATITQGTNLALAFTANSNGTSLISVKATDAGSLSVTNTFVVTVAPVNDAPSFTLPGSAATTPSTTLTGLNGPYALAFDGAGNLYVANINASTVSKFVPGATTPSATLTGLNGPAGLAIDGAGNIYVANYQGTTVSKFAPGATTASATLTGLDLPYALVFDGAGNLYVANNNASTVSKFAPGATTASATLTGLEVPDTLAFDGAGNLFVANDLDGSADTVSKFVPGTTTPSATLTGLNGPGALAFDGSGNLFVANYGANTVSKFAPGATTASATLTGLSRPRALAFDGSGNLYVANSGGTTVSKFAPGATTPSATFTGLNAPIALAFDGLGNLFVANLTANTVSKFTSAFALSVSADCGLVTSNNVAQDISAGPADESGQSVNFLVSNDHNEFFSVQPAIDANGTLTFTPLVSAVGTATVTVQAHDNGGTADGGVDTSAAQTFIITITPPANTAPTVPFPIAGLRVNEDAANVVRNLTAVFADMETTAKDLTYAVVANTNSGLVTATITQGTNLTLAFTANSNGTSQISVSATDAGMLSVTNTFVVTVTPVNDAPSVSFAPSTVTILEDAGAQTVNSFATFSPGLPPNEADQTLVGYTVTVNNPGLFSVAPAIDNTGKLTFTAAANSNGTATVTVVVQDSGGTGVVDGIGRRPAGTVASLGVDKSTNTFTIVVTPVNDVPSFMLPSASATTASATLTGLSVPYALAFDGAGNLFVANYDANTVSKFAPGATTASATLTGLSGPSALAFDGAGNLFVASSNANTVSQFAPGATTASATLTGLNGPYALAFDGAGNLLVANYNDTTVSKFAPGSTTAGATLTGLNGPDGLAFDRAGNLYVANYSANTVSKFAPGATTASATLTGLSGPYALAFDGAGNLYVANYDGTTVSKFAPGATTASATLAGLSAPSALVFDGAGNLYVANYSANTVSKFAPGATTASATLTGLTGPTALAFDGAGNLHVANYDGTTVSKFTTAYALSVPADSGLVTSNTFATAISPGPVDESAQVVNFLVSNDNNSLFSVQPAIDANGTLTFTPLVSAVGTATVTVQAHDNGGTANGGVDTSAAQTFTITTLNTPPTVASAIQGFSVNEDAANVVRNLTAVFADAQTPAVSLTYAVVANTNSGLVTATITQGTNLTLAFTANSNGTSQISVSATDAGDLAVTNTFVVTVTPVNDAPSVTFAQSTVTVLEDAGAQSLAAFATFLAGPPNEADQTLVGYAVSVDNAGLFSVAPAIDNSGQLTFTPAANSNGTAIVTVVAQDSGGTGRQPAALSLPPLPGGVDKSTNTFTLVVLPVNDAPSVTFAQNPVTVLEDAGAQSLPGFATFSPGPPNEADQTLVGYTVTVDNAGLFSVAPAIDNNGKLTFTTAANSNGTATVTVVVQDSGGTTLPNNNRRPQFLETVGVDKSTNTFVINVTPVNDPPTFQLAGNVLVDENSGAYSRTSFASAVSRGPQDESGQTVNFHVTNDNTPLFSVQPAISTVGPRAPAGISIRPAGAVPNGGTLTFTPAANAYGVAHVTVTAQDTGGTANGGNDSSEPQQFTITVFAPPVNTVPGTQTNSSNKPLYFTVTNAVDNSIYVSDPDSTNLTVTLTVTNGTVTVPTTNGLEVAGNSTTNLALYGSIANLNAALQTLTYLSFTNAFGGDLLTVATVDDTPIGGQTNVVPTTVPIYIEVPTLGGIPKVSLDSLNTPTRTVTNVVAVTNGPNALDTNFVQGISFNAASNVVNVLPVGGQDGSTNRTTITVTVQYSDGTTDLITVPVVIYQPLLTSVTGDSTYNSTFGTPIFNPQTSLYEQKVSVVNHTPFDFAALRITATNLPAGVMLRNASITNGGLPYIEYNLPVPSGSTQTLTLEYYSTRRGTPVTPGLKLELLNQSRVIPPVSNPVAQAVLARRGYAPDGRVKFYIEFPTVAGRIYYVQYKDAVGDPWKTSPVNIIGTGNRLNWMDEGAPNTDSAPGLGRFYQIVTGN
ncbi:MAG: hypothetical protein EBS05_05890 [Proteobacteria bacterium]|nr:hypothetical protein [Pseudomonadota bacterium]